MITINISGIKPGDSLSVSVSQGAITAGPVSIPAWGGGGAGGTITINADEMALQVAPHVVRFSIDLSASDFDTPGEVPGGYYDAQKHDLIYLWDFGDTAGNWTAPVNVLASWKNRNTAKGPWVAHMYTQPGTYNPSVLVIEPSSGKTATATLTGVDAITVLDPDDVYSGTDTICVNPVGDSDFTGEPGGNARVNIDDFFSTDSVWTSRLGGNKKRWLFKRGATFDMNVTLASNTTNGVYFGSYGASGVKPVLNNIGEGDTDKNQLWTQAYGANTPTVSAPIYLVGLHFKGTYDPATEWANTIWYSGFTGTAIHLRASVDMAMSEVDFTGLGHSSFRVEPALNGAPNHVYMDHCTVNEFGGQYSVFMGPSENPESSFVAAGCRLAQKPDAVDTDTTAAAGSRATIRCEHHHHTHIRGCDVFLIDGSQPGMKLLNIPRLEGAVINVHSCSFEGGTAAIFVGGSTGIIGKGLQRSNIQNTIIDGIIYVGAWNTIELLYTECTGTTVRNCLSIAPNAKRFTGAMTGIAACKSFVQLNDTKPYSSTVGAQPIRIYNNTFLFERTLAENNNNVPAIYVNNTSGGYTNVSEANNVLHMPNLGGSSVTTFAPLTSDQLWTPRATGRRNPYTFVFDTDFATPTDAVKDSIPDTGSAAIDGSTTGRRALYDLYGTKRVDGYTIGTVDAGYAET